MRSKGDGLRRRICVFCGSSPGVKPEYLAEAVKLGILLGTSGVGLVYGGAQVGLMGALADAALAHGGEVIGVLPQMLAGVEVAHQGLSKLVLVDTMHERKARMEQEADAFVALPGGFGTLDEFFEILTWAQLGIHAKPCLLVNTDGYYDHLLRFLRVAIDEGFLKPQNHAYIQVVSNAEEAMEKVQAYWEDHGVSHEPPSKPAP